MEREIKFRAWDKANKKMIYPCSPKNDTYLVFEETGWFVVDHFTGKNETILASENGTLMQATGLKDKNGKEIFEGDILRHEDASYPLTVKYAGAGFVAGYAIKDAALEYDLHLVNADYEVIGNIYSNPELLTP